MALRLSNLVVRGEIYNTSWYSVHGWIVLRGRDQEINLQLTGNCAPDLAGWHFRFEARDADQPKTPMPDDLAQLQGFAWQQIGPTGEMTLRIGPRPGKSGGVQHCLRLTWSSQNGPVELELIDPRIEMLEYNDLEANPAGPARARADTDDELFDGDSTYADPQSGLSPAEEAILDDVPWDDESEEESDDAWSGDDEAEDPYDLLPDELKQQFDDAASQTDRDLDLDHGPHDDLGWRTSDDEASETIREMEIMDECLERGEGELLTNLFDGPLQLPRPGQLQTDAEAEPVLKTVLARLARCGVALAICHHFKPRDAYRLLVEEICVEERAYRELQGTQWVQTFMTSEYCPQCEEEFEREYQDYERRRRERGDDGGDDIPF